MVAPRVDLGRYTTRDIYSLVLYGGEHIFVFWFQSILPVLG